LTYQRDSLSAGSVGCLTYGETKANTYTDYTKRSRIACIRGAPM
jgi:hypothetical protein